MCNNLPNYYALCVMIVQTLHSMLKSSKNITHMHRCHTSNVTKSRTVALFWGKISVHFALFSDKFTRLARILHDRRSHRSRQISTLGWGKLAEMHIVHCTMLTFYQIQTQIQIQIQIYDSFESGTEWILKKSILDKGRPGTNQ